MLEHHAREREIVAGAADLRGVEIACDVKTSRAIALRQLRKLGFGNIVDRELRAHMRERLTPEQRIAPAADLDQLFRAEGLGQMPHHALVIFPRPGFAVLHSKRRKRAFKRLRALCSDRLCLFGGQHSGSYWSAEISRAKIKD